MLVIFVIIDMLLFIFVIFVFINTSVAVTVREYNMVHMTRHYNLSSLKDEYFDSDEFSTTNLYLGIYNPECESELINSPQFVGIQRVAGGNVVASATLPRSEYPFETDECVQVFFIPVRTQLGQSIENTTNMELRAFTEWSTERTHISLSIVNYFSFPIEIYWVDESQNGGISQGVLQPEAGSNLGSFLGHTFVAYKVQNGKKGAIVDFFVADGREYQLSPANRIEACDSNVEGSFVPTKLACDDMQGRFTEFTHQVWYHKRLGLNYVQPQCVHAVTTSGFKLLKMPVDTFSWLRNWYDKMRETAEYEGPGGPCMNQHVAPAEVAHLPSDMKDRLAEELKPILRDWYGGDLFMTSIYGVRKYTNGSVLRMHVDTVSTHVVSAIINVDQEVEEDWKLVILDHEDHEHSVSMEPGDMLLYESAKLLHGRPEPFKGAHYDNIFVHYKPYSGWEYDWV